MIRLYKSIIRKESKLYKKVIALDNHMNECSCSIPHPFDFSNIVDQNEITKYCLICGGYIESEK